MPANIMLPTKAKMTALVCSGRSRPKLSQEVLKLTCQKLSCVATSTPTSMPTMPHTRVASRNWRTILSLNSRVILRSDMSAGTSRKGAHALGAPEAAWTGLTAVLLAAAPAVTEAMAGLAVGGRIVGRWRVRKAGFFLRERQQRIALDAAYSPPRVLAQEENHEGEDQAKADRESEWDDSHGARDAEPPRFGFGVLGFELPSRDCGRGDLGHATTRLRITT